MSQSHTLGPKNQEHGAGSNTTKLLLSPVKSLNYYLSMKYWLIKSEPSVYSIDDMAKEKQTLWDSIRNYQARNYMMKDMALGDLAFFYHSNAEPPGIAGIVEISGPAEADPTQFNKKSDYHEPRATQEKPVWYCVRVKFKKKFKNVISLSEIKKHRALSKMVLTQKGSRLSVQPVTKDEFDYIVKLSSELK